MVVNVLLPSDLHVCPDRKLKFRLSALSHNIYDCGVLGRPHSVPRLFAAIVHTPGLSSAIKSQSCIAALHQLSD